LAVASRKVLAHDGGLMQVEVRFRKAPSARCIRIPHEQLTYVLSGEFEFTIGDETRGSRRRHAVQEIRRAARLPLPQTWRAAGYITLQRLDYLPK
jgi:hypothetical protein